MKQKGVAIAWMVTHPLCIIVCALIVTDLVIGWMCVYSAPNVLRVSFLDVGQGDAVFIEAPNGNQLLYDAGPPSGAVLRELSRVMPFWDRSIDVAVFSHPDSDHIGGFPEVFGRFDVDLALVSGARSENGVYDESEFAIEREQAKKFTATSGMRLELGGGAYADIFYPIYDASEMETNSASIVMRISYGDTAVLLSGDLPLAIENYIAEKEGRRLSAQILKAGHHGSRTSTSPYWLSAVGPETVVISAGRDNRYGHPHQEVLELFRAQGIAIAGTYEEGTITFTSDGTTFARR